jgi:hypothetical protein
MHSILVENPLGKHLEVREGSRGRGGCETQVGLREVDCEERRCMGIEQDNTEVRFQYSY